MLSPPIEQRHVTKHNGIGMVAAGMRVIIWQKRLSLRATRRRTHRRRTFVLRLQQLRALLLDIYTCMPGKRRAELLQIGVACDGLGQFGEGSGRRFITGLHVGYAHLRRTGGKLRRVEVALLLDGLGAAARL